MLEMQKRLVITKPFKMAGATRLELAIFPHDLRDVLTRLNWAIE
jgi:hypothetical protein